MDYGLTVNLHLAAMVVWIAAMIAAPLTLRGAGDTATARKILRGVATPALILTWLLGIWLAVQIGAFTQGWLHVKLLFVLALTALHGIALGRLRRMTPGGSVPGLLRALPWVTLLLAAVAVWLAWQKPF
ncbi:CopD family protein [Rubellimicrobium roseum]|uniref:Protoporphyrinogen IX oxidase n=1 Tax=Rubellimicrobium roseum TaxID=687525 RepID=A0A5C4NNW6_9RHOB|nr:CopD family protein [Rubellimicrobium roseum]TNC74089.1 hypothetical protein FHG71_02495 [Rubellimicrobium roseum]